MGQNNSLEVRLTGVIWMEATGHQELSWEDGKGGWEIPGKLSVAQGQNGDPGSQWDQGNGRTLFEEKLWVSAPP